MNLFFPALEFCTPCTALRERISSEQPEHARLVSNLEDRVRRAIAHAEAWKAAARRSLLDRKRAAKKRKAPDDDS